MPTFTLGVADVTPLEMAEAYATFAARGLHCSARPVTEIRDSRKNVVKDYPKQCQQVLPSSVADAVNDVLRGVMEPGGFGNNAGINTTQVSAGKTGTTNEPVLGVVRRLHPEPRRRVDDRGRQPGGQPGHHRRQADRRPHPLRGVRLRAPRARCGATR